MAEFVVVSDEYRTQAEKFARGQAQRLAAHKVAGQLKEVQVATLDDLMAIIPKFAQSKGLLIHTLESTSYDLQGYIALARVGKFVVYFTLNPSQENCNVYVR